MMSQTILQARHRSKIILVLAILEQGFLHPLNQNKYIEGDKKSRNKTKLKKLILSRFIP